MAAINSGPPNADATIQRMTNQEAVAGGGVRGGACSAPHHQQYRQQRHHTQFAAADRDRHLVHAEPHAGDRTRRAGHVAVGDHQLQQRHCRDDNQRHQSGAECDPQ